MNVALSRLTIIGCGLILAGFLLLMPALSAPHSASGGLTFSTPEEAIHALIRASDQNDTNEILKIFGPDGKDIAESGDPARDKADREEFARLGNERLEIIHDPKNPDRVTFSIGNEDWPFPVPLIRQSGKWEFDSAKGKLEILAHRIGENELDTVDTCRAFVEAELKYAESARDESRTLQYAQRALSSEGKQDGLYSSDAAKSLVPLSFAKAVAGEDGSTPAGPYHGYYFRILMSQGPESPGGAIQYVVDGKMIGGFALIAWPAEHGVTGIQTFIVNHQGLVYSKDLGPDTSQLATRITTFNPDRSWRVVDTD
jgi:hypothetical protein